MIFFFGIVTNVARALHVRNDRSDGDGPLLEPPRPAHLPARRRSQVPEGPRVAQTRRLAQLAGRGTSPAPSQCHQSTTAIIPSISAIIRG